MVSDQEIAKGVETLLRQSEPHAVTSINEVVQQLEAKLGLDLSHKAAFIRDQISLLLRSHPPQPPQQPPQPPPPQQQLPPPQPQPHHHLPKDHFVLQHYPQFPTSYPQQFPSHFALHAYHPHPYPFPHPQHHHQQDLNFLQPPPQPPAQQNRQPQTQPQSQPPPQRVVPKVETFAQNVAAGVASEIPKESAPAGTKRRGGPGGLNKVCSVSAELQAVVGEPALPRTEIVKQLWAYIRKNNLQDPSNKRKIICDDALRLVFETDCTDMFKMNKLLAKHITALEPTKTGQAKRLKVEVEPKTENAEPEQSAVIISEALAKFLGVGEREMLKTDALKYVWEYIKVNRLEDPLSPMVILCDEKLRELLGCESISALGVAEMLARHHLFKRS